MAWITQRLVLLERLTGRQARYLTELLEAFDEGVDLDGALRRAIPLGGARGPGPDRIMLGVPSPRAELHIAASAVEASSVLPLGLDVELLLRERYEAAFRALDGQGRYRDAAFVLEELLRQHERAVDYLEQHGEIRLAAQVAEARALTPPRVVALWFRAGERERAIAVARRTGAMVEAIERLERIDRALGASLRLEYADLLASAGDYLRAVEIAWPVAEARALSKSWLARGLEAGGLVAARLWPRAFVVLDPSLEEVRSRLLPRISERSIDAALFRRTFATQALAEPLSPLGIQVLKLAYRGLLRDRHEFGRDVDALVRKVEEQIGDAVLVADAPSLTARPTLAVSNEPLVFSVLESGTVRAYDAVSLPDGRMLVAMGELGVRLLSRTGATELVFATPAHGLVIDDRGERAIAVASRADVVRLARIDLVARRAEPWFDSDAYAVCGSFDGESFYVARFDSQKSTLVCFDALARDPSVLFSLNDLDGSIVDVARDPSRLRVLVNGSRFEEAELFSFDLPSRILRSRRTPEGDDLFPGFGNLIRPSRAFADPLVLDADRARALSWADSGEEASRVVVYETRRGLADRVVLELGGAHEARLRCHGELVTVVDDRGRLVVLDHRTLAVVSVTQLT